MSDEASERIAAARAHLQRSLIEWLVMEVGPEPPVGRHDADGNLEIFDESMTPEQEAGWNKLVSGWFECITGEGGTVDYEDADALLSVARAALRTSGFENDIRDAIDSLQNAMYWIDWKNE